jgi:putative ABC transport system ATP-binding protein
VLNGKSEDQIAAFRGRNVGIVFQSFHLIPNMTALENVAVPLELAGAATPSRIAGASWRRSAWRAAHPLSGRAVGRRAAARGDRPRAGAEPRILIADEPTGNLDQATGRQIADLLFAKAANAA